jgi:dipeptidyl aminopeptidase/acylaminoacyl peptidase
VVVAQAAICDLVTGALAGLGDGAVLDLMQAMPGDEPERYRQASAAALLPLGLPILVVTGTEDDSVPPAQSEAFATAAEAAGDDVTLVLMPGEGHFGHLDPASPIWRVTAGWLADRLP